MAPPRKTTTKKLTKEQERVEMRSRRVPTPQAKRTLDAWKALEQQITAGSNANRSPSYWARQVKRLEDQTPQCRIQLLNLVVVKTGKTGDAICQYLAKLNSDIYGPGAVTTTTATARPIGHSHNRSRSPSRERRRQRSRSRSPIERRSRSGHSTRLMSLSPRTPRHQIGRY